MVQYPDLPSSISAINMNLLVENPDGIIENTLINLRQFHLELGNNPVDAKAVIDGLETMKIDASLDAKVNLEELNQMLPMEGLSLKGLFSANVKANGTYDSATSQFPTVDATMNLNNGYVKTAEFPSVIDNMKFDARIANQNGEMSETEVWVNDFNMTLDNEPFAANLYLKDLSNYTWDLSAKGTLDLEKIARIMELEDMTLRGKIAADINTKGDMAAVEAERYDQLPTSGNATVENFYFESPDLPQGFTINNATATFNPNRINLTRFTGAVGVSDLNLRGQWQHAVEVVVHLVQRRHCGLGRLRVSHAAQRLRRTIHHVRESLPQIHVADAQVDVRRRQGGHLNRALRCDRVRGLNRLIRLRGGRSHRAIRFVVAHSRHPPDDQRDGRDTHCNRPEPVALFARALRARRMPRRTGCRARRTPRPARGADRCGARGAAGRRGRCTRRPAGAGRGGARRGAAMGAGLPGVGGRVGTRSRSVRVPRVVAQIIEHIGVNQ